MKTWQFWVIVLLVILVVVPLIYYAITANTLAKVVKDNPQLLMSGCSDVPLAKPPIGMNWICQNGNWNLVNI